MENFENMTNGEITQMMASLEQDFEKKKEKITKLCAELEKLNEQYKKLSEEIKKRQGEN